MSHLISRILLSIFLLPAAALVYMAALMVIERMFNPSDTAIFIACGLFTWVFAAVYWMLIWLGTVQMTGPRLNLTILAAVGSAGIGGACCLIGGRDREIAAFIGSVLAPLSWLIAVTFIWRETVEERTERIRSVSKSAIVCPKCGYNLTGLQTARCPECGTQYTLDELLAGQPTRPEAQLLE
ncbi:MAG TPA: hypothetical protein VHS31_14210 [Tepidisphaeraceae bacterium]|jgi:hypothetical protein|nr:hypothetical protein [Tepidisphaeraceae bacterium]